MRAGQPPTTPLTEIGMIKKKMDLRKRLDLYRVGIGEQGVLLVEPYKSELLPLRKFATSQTALRSSRAIWGWFLAYKRCVDFVGMDMARKYLQMGYTRSSITGTISYECTLTLPNSQM